GAPHTVRTTRAGYDPFDIRRITLDDPSRCSKRERSEVHGERLPEPPGRIVSRWSRQMRDVSELVRQQHLAPIAELGDVLARIGACSPQDDGRAREVRPGRSVGEVERIIDHDLRLPRRGEADYARDRGIDRV